MTEQHLTDQKFADLDLADELKRGLSEAGFEYCTPIQRESLPFALAGKDVAGQAQTGTGKTVAFLLAACHHLLTHAAGNAQQPQQVRGLILAPTRELAIQIYDDAQTIARYTNLTLGLVYGGTGYDEQKQTLENGVDLLIGTPGRLIDFYKQSLFGLKFAQTLVIDEADRMFDLGFIRDIRFLLRKLPAPQSRLNLLYSATLGFRVMELAFDYMNEPQEVKIDSERRIADKIDEYAFYPGGDEKVPLLVNLLEHENAERALVFVNTRHAAEAVSAILQANGISNAALSGDVPQKHREHLLNKFKDGSIGVLVATDVAARGLHIPEVSHVFNYDLPQDPEDYVHRIGRTARAGESGVAISFLCERYAYSIEEIESYIGHSIEKRAFEPWMLKPINAHKVKQGRERKDPKTHQKTREYGHRSKAGEKTFARQIEKPQHAGHTLLADTAPAFLEASAVGSPADSAAQTDDKSAMVMNELNASASASSADSRQANAPRKKSSVNPFITSKGITPLRFSRKFGEVPLLG